GGVHWHLISGQPGTGLPLQDVSDLISDPANPYSFYAVVSGVYNPNPYVLVRPGLGVFHSTDGGQHWQSVNTGISPQDMANSNSMQLAVSYSVDPNTGTSTDAVFVNQFGPNNAFSDVYRTVDGGNTWVQMDSPGEVETVKGQSTFVFMAGNRGF